MAGIKTGDYIISKRNINKVEPNSVGFVAEVNGDAAEIFFIGIKQSIKVHITQITFLDLSKTGKPYPSKICNVCHILKGNDEFDVNQTDAKGRKTTRPSCKNCRILIDGEPLKSDERKRMLEKKPKGVFTCPICQKTSIPFVTANLVIDHDHNTGNARDWICDSCNTGLGRFKDNVKLLEAVIKYLQLHGLK